MTINFRGNLMTRPLFPAIAFMLLTAFPVREAGGDASKTNKDPGEPIEIGARRELFIDDFLIDRNGRRRTKDASPRSSRSRPEA